MADRAVDTGRIRRWLFDDALPLWAGAGLDQTHGGFVEQLRLDGTPDAGVAKRLRVQARQVFTYCLAADLDWPGPALDIARHGASFLAAHYWHEGGGWVFTTAEDGTVQNPTREAYEQAFALLGLGALAAQTRDPALDRLVDQTLGFLDGQLADPTHGGFRESVPDKLPRRQNPHMHLLEALLVLYEARQDAALLDRAGAIIEMFRDKFRDPATGTLGEFFTDDWQPADGEEGDWVEPGHHFEWVWLLHQYGRLAKVDVSADAARLFDFARQYGVDNDGLAFDRVRRDGTVSDDNKRLWVQTEAIKALVARAEFAGDEAAEAALGPLVDQVFATYLDVPGVAPGAWQDHVRRDRTGFATTAPASSFYHLILAFAEVLRVFHGRD